MPDRPRVLLATLRISPEVDRLVEVDQGIREVAGVRGLLDLIATLNRRIDDLSARVDQLGAG